MASFDFTPGNTSTGWFSIDGQTRPFGQWEYSTNISNAHQLQLMAMNLDASYRLTSQHRFFQAAFVGGKYPGMWSPAGFSPIGDLFTQFTGSLDGQNHVISNLTINLPTDQLCRTFRIYHSHVHAEQCQLAGRNRHRAEWVGILAGSVVGDHQQCLGDRRGLGPGGYGGGLAGETR